MSPLEGGNQLYKYGKELYELVAKWNLREDIAQHRARDYALLHAPLDWLPPENPRNLVGLAVYFGHWDLAEHHRGVIQQDDFKLLVRDAGRSKEGIDFLLRNFTEVGRPEAKLILSLGFTKQLYPLITHLGGQLYEIAMLPSIPSLLGAVDELVELGCLADADRLAVYISKPEASVKNVRGMMYLGAEVTDRVRDAARKRFRQWWLLSETQVLEMYALYGVDPATFDEGYWSDSFTYQIRRWLRCVSPEICYLALPTVTCLRPCMARIAEVEQR